MKVLSKPIQRVIALAILGIILFFVNAIVISPLSSFWSDQNEHVEILSTKFVRYKNLLASEKVVKRQKQVLESQIYSTGVLRKGDSPSMVAAEVQSQIRQIVGNLGGTVLSTEELSLNEDKQLHRVGVRVNCEGDLSVMVGILKASETDRPRLFIDNLIIRGQDLTQYHKTLPKLTLSFDAYGYVLGGNP